MVDSICEFPEQSPSPIKSKTKNKRRKGNGFIKYKIRQVKGIQFSTPLVTIKCWKGEKHHINSVTPTSAFLQLVRAPITAFCLHSVVVTKRTQTLNVVEHFLLN